MQSYRFYPPYVYIQLAAAVHDKQFGESPAMSGPRPHRRLRLGSVSAPSAMTRTWKRCSPRSTSAAADRRLRKADAPTGYGHADPGPRRFSRRRERIEQIGEGNVATKRKRQRAKR